MKKKKLKKIVAVLLALITMISLSSIASYAEVVPNNTINYPDTYNLGSYSVNGYATLAMSSDTQFLAVTMAGKVIGSSQKATSIGCSGAAMNNRYLKMNTHSPSGIAVSTLSYNGSGSLSGNESSMTKRATTIYYILVDAEVRASSATKSYIAYTNITTQT